MKYIKIKSVSFIILLIVLILSSTIVYADDEISNESLSKLKEKEHLYFEDFDALKTENFSIYVIDKGSGETVYPQRIKNEDLIELEEKLSKKEITDFSKEAFPSYYEKYSIYNFASKDGTEYLIFLESTKVTVSFKSKVTPYLLFIEGERIKVNTETYDFSLPKGKVYKVKAEYDNRLKELELDLTNPEVSKLEQNISFGISSEKKIILISVFLIAFIVILGVLYFKKSVANGKHGYIESPKDKVPTDNNTKDNIPTEVNNGNTEIAIQPEDQTGNIDVVTEPTNQSEDDGQETIKNTPKLTTQQNDYETLAPILILDTDIYTPENYVFNFSIISMALDQVREGADVLKEDLNNKLGEITGIYDTATYIDKKDLNKLKYEIEDVIRTSERTVRMPLIKCEESFNNINIIRDEEKNKKIYEIINSLNITSHKLNALKLKAEAIKDRIIYIKNINSGIPERSSKYIEESFEAIVKTIKNSINELENRNKSNINSITDNIKQSISDTMSNLVNDLDFLTQSFERIKSDSLENKNSTELLNKLIIDYSGKEYYFKKQIAELENNINTIVTNKVSVSQEVKETVNNIIIGERPDFNTKSDELVEKLGRFSPINEVLRDKFKHLDEESIVSLSLGEKFKPEIDKYERCDYSLVYSCYIKALERELMAIVGKRKVGLREYVNYLDGNKEWANFIKEINSKENNFIKYRNDAAHTEPIPKEVVVKLRYFLFEKKEQGKNGWLSFIDEQKSKLRG